MFAYTFKKIDLPYQIILNLTDGRFGTILRGNKNIGGIDGIMVVKLKKSAAFGIEGRDLFYLIPKKLNPDCIIRVGGKYINCITFYPEILPR